MSTRLFVSASLGNGHELRLHGDQARYLGRVLRLAIGDRVCVFNGDDGEWRAILTGIARDSVTLRVDEAVAVCRESSLKTHLVQGISRGDRMDFVVQKATELGVKRITPVSTEYGVVRLDGDRAEKRREHWQRVAESACEQCGRMRPPRVDAPLALDAWFAEATARDSTQLILAPGATRLLGSAGPIAEKLCLLIGPEGGFSERELDNAQVAGFVPVSLGPRVLRTETAALAALAIAQATWGDMN
jgi:16S rRNA (uracil1498-N3)-methyltransferase